jgi:HSP20 family protein
MFLTRVRYLVHEMTIQDKTNITDRRFTMTRIVRWNPIREFATLQGAVDRLFDETWRNSLNTYDNGNLLPLDVYETATGYQAVVSLPGINPDQIEVTFHNETLTISAEVPEPTIPENTKVLMMERAYGKMMRSVTLPQPIKSDAIEADYQNGVLVLTLPKSPDAQPRSIRVRTNASQN